MQTKLTFAFFLLSLFGYCQETAFIMDKSLVSIPYAATKISSDEFAVVVHSQHGQHPIGNENNETYETLYLFDSDLNIEAFPNPYPTDKKTKTGTMVSVNGSLYATASFYRRQADSADYGLFEFNRTTGFFAPRFSMKHVLYGGLSLHEGVSDIKASSILHINTLPYIESGNLVNKVLYYNYHTQSNTIDTAYTPYPEGVWPVEFGFYTDSNFVCKRLANEPRKFNVYTREFSPYVNDHDNRHRPKMDPRKNPFLHFSDTWYSMGVTIGTEKNGSYSLGWENVPSNIWLYKYDEEFQLKERIPFRDSLNAHLPSSFNNLSVKYGGFDFASENELFIASSSFLYEEFHGLGPINQFRAWYDTDINIIKSDTSGNVLCQNRFFEGDNANHFNFHVFATSDGGAILLNTVVGLDSLYGNDDIFPSVEIMKVDEFCNISSIRNLNQAKENSLILFPNPTTDRIFLKGSVPMANEGQTISIYDNSGRLLKSANYTSQGLNVESLPNGPLHVMVVDKGNIVFQGTFVKK